MFCYSHNQKRKLAAIAQTHAILKQWRRWNISISHFWSKPFSAFVQFRFRIQIHGHFHEHLSLQLLDSKIIYLCIHSVRVFRQLILFLHLRQPTSPNLGLDFKSRRGTRARGDEAGEARGGEAEGASAWLSVIATSGLERGGCAMADWDKICGASMISVDAGVTTAARIE